MIHSTDGLRRANMSLQVSVPLQILKGQAQLQFPPVFKREALTAKIQCKSLAFMDDEGALNEPFFVVCSASMYRDQYCQMKKNILGMFQYQTKANVVSFDYFVPLTFPQEEITVEIVDFKGKIQNIAALAVFRFEGLVNNHLMTM